MTVLIVWGNLGNFIAPYFRENYKNFNIVHRNSTLKFVPNADRSYDISSVPFLMEKDFGRPLSFENHGKSSSVSYSFSFFGKEHSRIQAAPLPALFFHLDEVHLSYDLSLYIPSIQAVGILIPYLVPEKEKVFCRKTEDEILFTWNKVHVQSEGEKLPEEFSVQILLKKNGTFYISYIDMPNAQKSSGQGMSTTLDYIGIFPGNGSLKESLSWNSDLPYFGKETAPIAENYFTEYRKYMHERLVIIAEMLVLISIIILFAFPYFFSLNLTKPLQDLVHAMKTVVSGNLNRSIVPIYNDEIGFLTDSFNKMIDSIRETDAAYRKFVPREFLSYVNKKKITEIRLGDHSIMEMSVLFSDLRSYTSLSEKMTPDQSFKFLNSYLGMLGP
ncbi:MAG TPA: HAMP domain-containing protein, partial [Leptospiraceae bacterium]|nr:HAMP domain-containing protein [Leptospiraceae bacterium]